MQLIKYLKFLSFPLETCMTSIEAGPLQPKEMSNSNQQALIASVSWWGWGDDTKIGMFRCGFCSTSS